MIFLETKTKQQWFPKQFLNRQHNKFEFQKKSLKDNIHMPKTGQTSLDSS